MQGLPGVEEIEGNAVVGGANVSLRFAIGTDMKNALVEVIGRLSRLPPLPRDADRRRSLGGLVTPTKLFVACVAAAGTPDSRSSAASSKTPRARLEAIPGVASVNVNGGPPDEVGTHPRPRTRAARVASSQLERFNRLAANVRPGQTVSVRDHGSEKRGTVRTVVPVGDDRSRQFEVRIALSDSAALVGTPVEVSRPATSERSPSPCRGMRSSSARTILCAARHPRQHRRAARCDPGARMADSVEVRGPLAPGDKLVVRGAERLTAGQAVKVIATTPAAPRSIHPD